MSRNTIYLSARNNFMQQVQFNYLFQTKTRFLYDTTVNYLKTEILRFQSHTNLFRLSSLKGWVQDSAFSACRFLIPTPQIRYMYTVYTLHSTQSQKLQFYQIKFFFLTFFSTPYYFSTQFHRSVIFQTISKVYTVRL